MATILKSEQRDFQESPDKIDHYRIFPMFSPEVPQLGKFFQQVKSEQVQEPDTFRKPGILSIVFC
jgi:hypothetical protein